MLAVQNFITIRLEANFTTKVVASANRQTRHRTYTHKYTTNHSKHCIGNVCRSAENTLRQLVLSKMCMQHNIHSVYTHQTNANRLAVTMKEFPSLLLMHRLNDSRGHSYSFILVKCNRNGMIENYARITGKMCELKHTLAHMGGRCFN